MDTELHDEHVTPMRWTIDVTEAARLAGDNDCLHCFLNALANAFARTSPSSNGPNVAAALRQMSEYIHVDDPGPPPDFSVTGLLRGIADTLDQSPAVKGSDTSDATGTARIVRRLRDFAASINETFPAARPKPRPLPPIRRPRGRGKRGR